MRHLRWTGFVLVLATLLALPVQAGKPSQWTSIGLGVWYQKFTRTINIGTKQNPINRPQVIYVAKMNAADTNVTIETGKGPDYGPGFGGETATVQEQAALYDDAINAWGDGTSMSYGVRNSPIVAINGSGFPPLTGEMTSGYIHSGSYEKAFANDGAGVFFWKYNRTGAITKNVTNTAGKQQVTFVGKGTMDLDAINDTSLQSGVPGDWLCAYTADYGVYPYDYIGNSIIYVVVKLAEGGVTKPLAILPPGTSAVHGTVTKVTTLMPELSLGYVVLQATGSKSTQIQGYGLAIGAQVDINLQLMSPTFDGTKTYSAVAGWKVLIDNGTNVAPPPATGEVREARTAVGLANNTTSGTTSYVYFIVVDNDTQNNPQTSIGMYQDELALWVKANLTDVNYLVNQDGGPSSQMVIKGALVNIPQKGQAIENYPRRVANSLMMINLRPKTKDYTFAPGDSVRTLATGGPAYTGPGMEYPWIGTLNPDFVGVIEDMDIAGISAHGHTWWPVLFSGYSTPIWIRQQDLTLDSFGPNSLVKPSPTSTIDYCYGWTRHYTGGFNNGYWAELYPTTPNADPCESDALWEYYNLPVTGVYDLYMWWPMAGPQYCTRTESWIWSYDTSPYFRFETNQSINPQMWVWLGTANLDAAYSWNVHMETDSYDVGKTVQAAATLLRPRTSSGSAAADDAAAMNYAAELDRAIPNPYVGTAETFQLPK